jgi:hypothetical protein
VTGKNSSQLTKKLIPAQKLHLQLGKYPHLEVLMRGKSITIFLILALTLLGTGSAIAAASFGGFTGPVWINPGYRFTLDVSSISEPDKVVCLQYSVNNYTNTENCSCHSPECDPSTSMGTWTCTIPQSYNNTTISWDMSTWTAGSDNACGNKATQGPTGTFDTYPTAMTFSSFSSRTNGEISPVLPAILVTILFGADLISRVDFQRLWRWLRH